MAVGTTSDSNLTRSQLIRDAYDLIGVTRSEDSAAISNPLLQSGVRALNLIIREVDGKMSGIRKALWALAEDNLILVARQTLYSSTAGLSTSIMDLVSATFRDTDGGETPIDIITREHYEDITDKDETGDPTKIYLEKHATIASQKLYIWPAPSAVTAGSVVTGTDANDYTCIQSHTSVAATRPITGDSYTPYWKQTGSGGSAWATATSYSNGELIHYVYRRPLYDFDTASDNPDMPQEWTRYLKLRLAYDLAGNHGVELDERKAIRRDFRDIETEVFPATQHRARATHNKYKFF